MKLRYIGAILLTISLTLVIGCGWTPASIAVVEATAIPPTQLQEETVIEPDEPERMLLIGDMRVCGLRDHARFDGADYFCCPEMSVFNIWDVRYQDLSIRDLLAEGEYDIVVVCLGLNESGYPLESLERQYGDLVRFVIQTQPQAMVVLHGLITVGHRQAEQVPYTAPDNLVRIDMKIQEIARRYRVYYVGMDPSFVDGDGFLRWELSTNGCNLTPEGSRHWAKLLSEEIDKMEG